MRVHLGSPCCNCGRRQCCLGDASCARISGGNALVNFSSQTVFLGTIATEFTNPGSICASGLGAGDGFRSGTVTLSFAYTDPGTGKSVCATLTLILCIHCGPDDELVYDVYQGTSVFDVGPAVGDPEACTVLIQDTTGGFTHIGSGTVPNGACDAGAQSPFSVTATFLGGFGIAAQTLTLSIAPVVGDPECFTVKETDPNTFADDAGNTFTNVFADSFVCPCALFDGGDVLTPDGQFVTTDCCPLDPIPRILGIAIANVSCEGCIDGLLGSLVYIPALGAWTGNFIACGTFIAVYFYCVPQFNTFGIVFLCAGITATPDDFVVTCNPFDAQATLRYPVIGFQPPCCLTAGGSYIVRVYQL